VRPRPGRGPALAASVAAAGLLMGGAGCAGGPAPWDVPPSKRARFEETRRLCHDLTDQDGRTRPEPFDRCMERRGFSREAWWRFWN